MKIDPKHDYKKPIYAIGMAALIGTTAILGTACGPQLAGAAEPLETTEDVQLEGEVPEITVDGTDPDDGSDLVLDGEADICETGEEG
ncbi:MAG: hypothetical protein IKG01_12905 [Lachnospiraceae bacterium]|nr:hypothetical protein [Lachnospiraceae bacterium]